MNRAKKVLAFLFVAVLYCTASIMEYNDQTAIEKQQEK